MSSQTNDDKFSTRRGEPSSRSLLLRKVCSGLSYLLLVVTAFYYAFPAPKDRHGSNHGFWRHQSATLFAQSSIITSVYGVIVFSLQLLYASCLGSSNAVYFTAAANISTPYVASNLLLLGFIHLWVRSYLWPAELLLVVNFFNLSATYFRHSSTPLAVHLGALAGPLAWNFAALYWVGAAAFRSTHLAAKIASHLSIWGWLGYGTFYLAAYKDYTIGFAISILSLSTGVGLFSSQLSDLQLQSIFAFTVAGVLLAISLVVSFPGLLGRDPFPRGRIVSVERERAPLLIYN